MSVLKVPEVIPSRIRGIFRYLLYAKKQVEKRDILEKVLSPDELIKVKNNQDSSVEKKRSMLETCIKECIKLGLLVEENTENDKFISLNPNLPEVSRNKKTGDALLANTLANLFFASDNEDEEDFGNVCAWFLAQDIYQPPSTWEEVQQKIYNQQLGELLKLSNDTRYGQMSYWMSYLGLAWNHNLDGKTRLIPDPTVYIKRNLVNLFTQENEKILLRDFIYNLANLCPLFESGKFRETIEANIGKRQPNYLSTSTTFALYRLQDEGYIQLIRESDADLMLLPKTNNEIDDSGRISHIKLRKMALLL